jgi:hypothetical protein
MAKRGAECVFDDKRVTVYKGVKAVLQGVLDPCGMYKMKMNGEPKHVNKAPRQGLDEQQVWHCRLGHLNDYDMKKMALQDVKNSKL